MNSSFTFLKAAACICGAVLPIINIQAQTYRLTDLGIPAGQQIISPAAINSDAQVAASSQAFAFRNTAGAWQNLGVLPGGNISGAFALNNAGQVVGDSQFTDGGSIRHAALFGNGAVTDLGTLPAYGNYSRATGVNNAGQVVGYAAISLSSATTHGFVWDAAGGMREFDVRAGGAAGINDAGMITGTWRTPGTTNAKHAYVWDSAAGMRDLGTIVTQDGTTFPETFSTAYAINADGHVVGKSAINTFDNREHAFLYDGTAMRDLGSLGGDDFYSDRSFAYAINSHDEVVGSTYRPYNGGGLSQIAFLYRGGEMVELGTLLDASGADYIVYNATGINDAGQIVAQATQGSTGERHSVILTPLAMPTSVVSRKLHGSSSYDVNLPLTGGTGVECRSGGASNNHQVIFTFAQPVTFNGATVTAGNGATASMAGPAFASPDGRQVTMNLTNVTDAQRLTITLTGVNNTADVTVGMIVLLSDVNGDHLVNSGDALQTRSHSGQGTDATNFRNDANTDGIVNSGDVLLVRARSGGSLVAPDLAADKKK